MAEDGKVVYAVKADTGELQKQIEEIEEKFEKSGKKTESKMGSVASGIGKAFLSATAVAAAAIGTITVAVGKASIESYAEYEQLIGGVETLFKESADIVEGYADRAFKTAGMTANEYMQTVTSFSASLLQSLDGDTKKAADAADMAVTDMADNANKMGTAMESIQMAYQGFAKQNYTMLDNLKLGYGGTKSEMERLLADAEKVSGIKYDITNLNDVYQAIHVIQGELGITGTTAKEASTTIQGSAASMKAAWGNLMTAFSADGWDVGAYVENFVDSLITFGDNLLPVITRMLPNLVDGILQLGESIIPYVKEAALQIIPSIVEAITEGIPVIFDLAASLISALMEGISSNASGMSVSAVEILTSFINQITSLLPSLLTLATDLVLFLGSAIINNIDKILEAGLELLLALIQGIVENLPKLIDATFMLVEKIIEAFINNLPKILEMGIRIILALVAGLIQALPRIAMAIPKLIASIIKPFISTDWGSVGKNIIDGIGQGIAAGWDWLVNSVSNLASSLFNTAKKVLGIRSPSRKFRYIGEMSGEGVEVGFEDSMDKAEKTVSRRMLDLVGTANVSLNAPDMDSVSRNISGFLGNFSASQNAQILVPLSIDGREIARASAWWTGEQLSWEEM